MMETIRLYKKGTKGETRVWQIDVTTDEDGNGVINSSSGMLDGKKVLSTEIIKEGKNVGKSNGTTPYEQAVTESESKAALKIKEGYVPDLKLLHESGTKGSGKKACMLAQSYDPTGAKKGSKNLAQLRKGKKNDKIAVQRKKDGNRANVNVRVNSTTNVEITFYSRSGDLMSYDFPHIKDAITDAIIHNPFIFTDGMEFVLDGEMFTKEISFNKLNGILRKKTLTMDHVKNLSTVKLHLYDVFSDEFYEKRHEFISIFDKSSSIHVEEYHIVECDESVIREWLFKFLQEGEEGLMLRDLNSPYQNKRTWDLCKYKIDQTDEYMILDIEKHALHDMIGAFVMAAPAGLKDRDGNAITSFKAGTTGISHEENKQMYSTIMYDKEQGHACEYIGNLGMVRFFEFSEYGIPRFPKFVGLRSDV